MAEELYGSQEEAIGKIIKLSGLPFTIVGTFRERVDTFGQTEVVDYTMLIPYTVSRYFHRHSERETDLFLDRRSFDGAAGDRTDPASHQEPAPGRVGLQRHESHPTGRLAEKTANALTLVLLLVAAVVLLVSGIGIMNIMLATVSSRIREIGIRKALGATNREIRFQFLAEAMTISLVGGLIGVVIGLAIPYSVRFLTEYRIPISGLSAIVAILVSSFVGVIFGTVPATRAAKLDPVESLRYE